MYSGTRIRGVVVAMLCCDTFFEVLVEVPVTVCSKEANIVMSTNKLVQPVGRDMQPDLLGTILYACKRMMVAKHNGGEIPTSSQPHQADTVSDDISDAAGCRVLLVLCCCQLAGELGVNAGRRSNIVLRAEAVSNAVFCCNSSARIPRCQGLTYTISIAPIPLSTEHHQQQVCHIAKGQACSSPSFPNAGTSPSFTDLITLLAGN